MSQENVEVVGRVVDAFNRHDWVEWESLYHAHAEWHDPPEIPGSTVHRGTEEIRRYFEELFEIAAGGWNIEIDGIESVGPDCVLIRARSVVVGRESGMATEDPVYQVLDLRDARVWRVRNYRSSREALEAVGLRE